MDISADILNINGILVSAKAKYGDLSKITHKGSTGQSVIPYIKDSLMSLNREKNYLENDMPKSDFKDYFIDFSILLLVNCEYSKPFEVDIYEHLTRNIPKLSTYLVTRLTIDMDMIEYFCTALSKLPMKYSCEVFCEFIPILDKMKDSLKLLRHTQVILNIIIMISSQNRELRHTDEMDKLLRHVPELIFFTIRISKEDTTKLKKNTLYYRAGWSLHNLLNLLLTCYETKTLEGVIIDKLIEATISVVRAVSLDMFIYWAEMDLPEAEKTMQAHLTETAYDIMEKFQPYRAAADLVQSLKPFAQKPKDIKEQISTASLDKIVLMVNKADKNQKKWFQALVFSSFFSNKKAVECLYKWGHLCDEDDVSRLLNQCVQLKHEELRKLALKCASMLTLEKLIIVIIRHFYNNGFVVLNDNQPEVIVWFNKLKDSELVTKDSSMELLLFILENPDFSVNFILTECIKNEFYISALHTSFLQLKDILKIHDICLNNLKKVLRVSPPSAETFQSYKKLIEIFVDINFITFETFSDKIICPLLVQYLEEDKYEEMKQLIVLVNNFEMGITVGDGTKSFFENLFKILERRTPFLKHNSMVQSVIQEIVHLIMNKISMNQEIDNSFFAVNTEEEKLTTYYKQYVCHPRGSTTLLQYLIEDFSVENTTRAICQLMKVLPCCVQDEWVLICSEVWQKVGFVKLIEILRDMNILLSDFTKSQEDKECFITLLEALKYCLCLLVYFLKTRILPLNDEENEIIITQSMVRLLAHFPEDIKETEGLNVIQTLMTEKSLRRLGNDKNFVTNICRIKNANLCKTIASKILK